MEQVHPFRSGTRQAALRPIRTFRARIQLYDTVFGRMFAAKPEPDKPLTSQECR